MLPEDVAEFLVDRVYRALALDVHEAVDFCLNALFCLCELGEVYREVRPDSLVGEVVLDGVRQYEVAVCETLHEG